MYGVLVAGLFFSARVLCDVLVSLRFTVAIAFSEQVFHSSVAKMPPAVCVCSSETTWLCWASIVQIFVETCL